MKIEFTGRLEVSEKVRGYARKTLIKMMEKNMNDKARGLNENVKIIDDLWDVTSIIGIYDEYTKIGQVVQNRYPITSKDDINLLGEIQFQDGLVENGKFNGVTAESVIDILIQRLESQNQGKFKCDYNDIAISSLKGAKIALESRAKRRQERGIFNTYEK